MTDSGGSVHTEYIYIIIDIVEPDTSVDCATLMPSTPFAGTVNETDIIMGSPDRSISMTSNIEGKVLNAVSVAACGTISYQVNC